MGRIEKLAERYQRHIALPWRQDLTGAERALFIVYDKSDERRLRAKMALFEMATKNAGHGWTQCDLTDAFAQWMAGLNYRDSYFEHPEDLELKLAEDFPNHVAGRVRQKLAAPETDADSVVAVSGTASLFGFLRISELMEMVKNDIRGRLLLFFPGEYENSNYRLLDARDGWNYLAVPISVAEERATYQTGQT